MVLTYQMIITSLMCKENGDVGRMYDILLREKIADFNGDYKMFMSEDADVKAAAKDRQDRKRRVDKDDKDKVAAKKEAEKRARDSANSDKFAAKKLKHERDAAARAARASAGANDNAGAAGEAFGAKGAGKKGKP